MKPTSQKQTQVNFNCGYCQELTATVRALQRQLATTKKTNSSLTDILGEACKKPSTTTAGKLIFTNAFSYHYKCDHQFGWFFLGSQTDIPENLEEFPTLDPHIQEEVDKVMEHDEDMPIDEEPVEENYNETDDDGNNSTTTNINERWATYHN